jgi:hypothetical protein
MKKIILSYSSTVQYTYSRTVRPESWMKDTYTVHTARRRNHFARNIWLVLNWRQRRQLHFVDNGWWENKFSLMCWQKNKAATTYNICRPRTNMLTSDDKTDNNLTCWQERDFSSTKAMQINSADVCWKSQINWSLLTKIISADICWTLPAQMMQHLLS